MVGYAIPLSIRQGGGGLPMYAGHRRQMGGNLFSTIGRIAIPLLKKLLPFFKTLGKRAAKSALNVGTGLAGDLISGKFKNAPANMRKRGMQEVNEISRDYLGREVFPPQQQQEGSGSKRMRMSINKKRAASSTINNKKARARAINKKKKALSQRQLALNSDIFHQ